MAITVHTRPLTPGATDEPVTVEGAMSWLVTQGGQLDLHADKGDIVATFASGSWLYAERVT